MVCSIISLILGVIHTVSRCPPIVQYPCSGSRKNLKNRHAQVVRKTYSTVPYEYNTLREHTSWDKFRSRFSRKHVLRGAQMNKKAYRLSFALSLMPRKPAYCRNYYTSVRARGGCYLAVTLLYVLMYGKSICERTSMPAGSRVVNDRRRLLVLQHNGTAYSSM